MFANAFPELRLYIGPGSLGTQETARPSAGDTETGSALGDLRLQGRRGIDVGLTVGAHALARLGEAAPVKGPGRLGRKKQCGVVVGDRFVVVALPQVDEATAVEKVGSVGVQFQRRIAPASSWPSSARAQQRELSASAMWISSRGRASIHFEYCTTAAAGRPAYA